MIRSESQAPSGAFEMITTIRTTKVVTAPIALITIEWRQRGNAVEPFRPSASQCRTIPVCESVKEVKTPTT